MTKPQSIDRAAVAALIVLCASWGFQQVSVKLALPELPPIAQAAIRSIGAGVLVGLWAWRTHRDLRAAEPAKVLLYQLAVSAVAMTVASLAAGEAWRLPV